MLIIFTNRGVTRTRAVFSTVGQSAIRGLPRQLQEVPLKSLYKQALFLAFFLGGSLAQAAPRTFDFIFDGASFHNAARAVGTITFDDVLLDNTLDPLLQYVNYAYAPSGPVVLALSVNVSGALDGNGNFGAADFNRVEWQTNGVLDLGLPLVGQATVDSPWGTPDSLGGDFNLFRLSRSAPNGVGPFELQTAGGESMLLVAMSPAVTAVPEPGAWAMLACGCGLLVLVRQRRRRAA
jgi:hypothetical protein